MEEENKALTLCYRLTQEDILLCLKSGRVFVRSIAAQWVKTGALAVLGAGFAGSYLFYKEHDASNLFLALVCAAALAAVWLAPYLQARGRAKELAQQKQVSAAITTDEIAIGSGETGWRIALDKTAFSWRAGGLLVLETAQGRLTAIPLCAAQKEEDRAFLLRCVQEGTLAGPPVRPTRRR